MGKKCKEFEVYGVQHRVGTTLTKIVLDDEPYSASELIVNNKRSVGRVYKLPIDNAEVLLYIDVFSKMSVIVNGIDVDTGKERVISAPGASFYVFLVLYAATFILILGGAIGGAINALGFYLSNAIYRSEKISKVQKILISIVLYIVLLVIEIILAYYVSAAFKSIR